MGLDITMYRCKDVEAFNAYEKRQRDAHEEIHADVCNHFGVPSLGHHAGVIAGEYIKRYKAWDQANPPPVKIEEIWLNSTKYPSHLFKIHYFRSSYNHTGFNNVVRAATGRGLYYIFGRQDKDGYRFVPDWAASLRCAKEVLDSYRSHQVEPVKGDWYLEALEIVVESCEYVLKQDNPQEYCLFWSA